MFFGNGSLQIVINIVCFFVVGFLKMLFMAHLLLLFQRGPNRVPVYALMVAASVTLIFIWVGQLNTLAPIVTMPFLLTYACVDYAYFALAQSFNIQQGREERFK